MNGLFFDQERSGGWFGEREGSESIVVVLVLSVLLQLLVMSGFLFH